MLIEDIYENNNYSEVFSITTLNDLLSYCTINDRIERILDNCVENIDKSLLNDSEIYISGGSFCIKYIQYITLTWIKRYNINCNSLLAPENIDMAIGKGCIYYGLIQERIWNYSIQYNPIQYSNDILTSNELDDLYNFKDFIYVQQSKAENKMNIINNIADLMYI